MDRYYLGKLVEDINQNCANVLRQVLGTHLSYFYALDERAEVGENHLKYLRYLYALNDQCPSALLLNLREHMSVFCRRFSQSDYSCSFHFGFDNHVPAETSDLSIVLQFYLLDDQCDHLLNKVLCAGLLDDPRRQLAGLPRWLHLDELLSRERLEEEVLVFSQHYISRDFDNLYQVRDFEAAFWRVVNMACVFLGLETYEQIVARFPVRFQPQLQELPKQWHELRQQERHFSREAFVRCSRGSFRFCQHLLEGKG